MKKYLIIILSLLITTIACADNATFLCKAPAQVIVGQPFQITYTVNQRARDIETPNFDGFDLLAGPYTSTSSSTEFINGKLTRSFSQTYTYTLMPQQEGKFTILPASIAVEHERINSNGVRITVLPADEEQPNNNTYNNTNNTTNANTSNSNTSTSTNADNIFVRTIVSRTTVSEQEALLVSYKLYFINLNVAQLTNNTKLPEFKGFLKQELEQGEIQTQLEHYNGRNYQTATLYQTVLYPQHSGEIRIEPATFEAVLRVQTRSQSRSIFDDFFGTYTNVTKALTAPAVTIHVKPLPQGKPNGFAGAVGQFNINSSISQTELNANDAVTLKLQIKGTGNLKLLKTPVVDWPEGFEEYDPKVTNDFKTTTAGVSGTKTIEYLAIPRAGGDYTIHPINFAFFDPQTNTYKTLSTPEYTLHVQRNATTSNENNSVVQNFTNKEDIKQLGSDIRYIHTNNIHTVNPPLISFGSPTFYCCYLIPLLLAILLFIIFRQQIRENADIRRVRYKKANKVAQKRLKQARKLLAQNNKDSFYEEIERALWTYLSDRLSIPTSELNKENITSILQSKNIDTQLITDLNNALSTAEFARYAPATSDHAMQDLYNNISNIINQLENKKI